MVSILSQSLELIVSTDINLEARLVTTTSVSLNASERNYKTTINTMMKTHTGLLSKDIITLNFLVMARTQNNFSNAN